MEPARKAEPEDVIELKFKPEAATPRTAKFADLEKEYTELKLKKSFLEKQNKPHYAPVLGPLGSRMEELELMMEEADLEAKLGGGDLDPKATASVQGELDKKREELHNRRERMEKARAGPLDGKK